jgi:acyl-CoA hydrolase
MMCAVTSSALSAYLRPGDTVVVGQATAEPRGLVRDLFELAPRLGHLGAFCGFSLNDDWGAAPADHLAVSSYCGQGSVRGLAARNALSIVPCHYSQLPLLFRSGRLAADVVLLQVGPADADGYHSLACSYDYVLDAAAVARAVLVEVNESIPDIRSPHRLHRDQVVQLRRTAEPLPQLPGRPPSDSESALARHVAALIPDGATVQLGIGTVAAAVAHALRGHRGLRLRTGMVGDWLLELLDSGAVSGDDPDACTTTLAAGSARLYAACAGDSVRFVTSGELTEPTAMAACSPFVAVNSALEVDLRGQANAETVAGRYVGAVGGQLDFFRAAHQQPAGLAVIALTATSERGARSRIVARIESGTVTSPQSDVDIVVTEHGAADIRATSLAAREKLLIALADERHRPALTDRALAGRAPAGRPADLAGAPS